MSGWMGQVLLVRLQKNNRLALVTRDLFWGGRGDD